MIKLNMYIEGRDDYELNLGAKNMNEMVEKIKEWQDWDEQLSTLKMIKKDTPERIKKDKATGWFYIKEKD